MTTDTRTPAERRYDAERDGSAFVRPGRVVLHTPIDSLTRRAGFVTGQLSYMLTNELERAHAERLLTLLEAMVNPAQVRETHNWHDTDNDGDICDEPRGPLAYTNYLAGQPDQGIAEISFPIASQERTVVYMFHRDELPLSEVEATLPNLLALLANPAVHAMREAKQ
jgi:hypothetical protein